MKGSFQPCLPPRFKTSIALSPPFILSSRSFPSLGLLILLENAIIQFILAIMVFRGEQCLELKTNRSSISRMCSCAQNAPLFKVELMLICIESVSSFNSYKYKMLRYAFKNSKKTYRGIPIVAVSTNYSLTRFNTSFRVTWILSERLKWLLNLRSTIASPQSISTTLRKSGSRSPTDVTAMKRWLLVVLLVHSNLETNLSLVREKQD